MTAHSSLKAVILFSGTLRERQDCNLQADQAGLSQSHLDCILRLGYIPEVNRQANNKSQEHNYPAHQGRMSQPIGTVLRLLTPALVQHSLPYKTPNN